MKKIKIYKDGQLLVFEKGSRVKMLRDIILAGEDGEFVSLFAALGDVGTLDTIHPSVSIKFDSVDNGVVKTFFVPKSLSLTDVIELIVEPYLRLVK